MYTGGSASGPYAQQLVATMASSPGEWSVFTCAPTRLCPSTCVPGVPDPPTGNAATSLRVKTVRSNPKEHSANSLQAIGYRGQSLGLSLNTGHWIKLPKDCALGPELNIFRWGTRVCARMCIHMFRPQKMPECVPPRASTVFILSHKRAKGWIKLASNTPAVYLAGAHRGRLNSGFQRPGY